jgi:hypothetical protein
MMVIIPRLTGMLPLRISLTFIFSDVIVYCLISIYTYQLVFDVSISRLMSMRTKMYPNTAWVRSQLCKLQKRCTRLAAASDKVYQLFAQGRWFSPGTPPSNKIIYALMDNGTCLQVLIMKIKC